MEKVLLAAELHRRISPDEDLRAFLARIYRAEKVGKFPARVRIGLRRVAWRESEIEDWFSNLHRGPSPRAA
jgi:hypothetical protein